MVLGMLSIVEIFGRAKVLVFWGDNMKLAGIFWGMPKCVGIFGGLKSGSRQNPCRVPLPPQRPGTGGMLKYLSAYALHPFLLQNVCIRDLV